MKSLILSITILISICVLSVYSFFTITNYNDEFNNLLNDFNNEVENGEMQKADETIDSLLIKWDKSKGLIDMLTRHETVNKIDEEISVLKPLFLKKEFGLLKAHIYKAKKLFDNLLHDETPSIQKLI